MEIDSECLGTVQVDEAKILTFPEGLLGFADARRFAMIDAGDDGAYFWLQVIDDPQLTFLSVVPWAFFPDYEPVLAEGDRAALGLEEPADALVLCLVTITDEAVTTNLLGPLVVNAPRREGRQVVLEDSSYQTRTPLAVL